MNKGGQITRVHDIKKQVNLSVKQIYLEVFYSYRLIKHASDESHKALYRSYEVDAYFKSKKEFLIYEKNLRLQIEKSLVKLDFNQVISEKNLLAILKKTGKKIKNPKNFSQRLNKFLTLKGFVPVIDIKGDHFIPIRDDFYEVTERFSDNFVWLTVAISYLTSFHSTKSRINLTKFKTSLLGSLEDSGLISIYSNTRKKAKKLIEYYCSLKRKPLFYIDFSKKHIELYTLKLSTKSTANFSAEFITAITTPDSIIVLDSLKSLKYQQYKVLIDLINTDTKKILLNKNHIKIPNKPVFISISPRNRDNKLDSVLDQIENGYNIINI